MSTDSLSPQTQRSESRLAVETVGLDVIAEADLKVNRQIYLCPGLPPTFQS